ncbi:serine carboxypeptidase [Cutaneotrichosporon oleaginosum]|uniref:Carboxypeptidase n=1 Tax=Cutaneotrichosporon oleaginosum TaxID=879819 RepID=A0A0J0XH38_9TREE|nr:serine carboxypeptidase [Cutaneotrichosporon oleaginosum]KLT40400.1 serine carboxypeptidase [Cutaneotrichosporon oleaginosum]TXT11365.1 hypothetical protein COLE_01775 [Cutaneotrichosporon oleaginosum]
MRLALTTVALTATALADPLGRVGFRNHAEFKARRAATMAELHKRQNNTTPARYRNDKTQPYYVASMPEVNFDFGEMYAGMIPLDRANPIAAASPTPSGEDDALFFIFKPKDGEPVDELTIWLNGGPGCSSMEGFLQEVGPINWLAGTFAPVPNPYAWSNLTNMLFVDQPVGTGYSTGTPTATSQEGIAADFLNFLRRFQDIFGIANYKIYVTGESYAGRYVPYIANAMLDANDTTHFDMSGILIYDPVIGSYDYMNELAAYPYIEAYNNVFNFNASFLAELKQAHQDCGFEARNKQYLTFPPARNQPQLTWDISNPANRRCDVFLAAMVAELSINPCFNPYDIVEPCPILWDVLGFPGLTKWTPPGAEVYFDRADVKAALHAPAINWTQCAVGDVFVAGAGKAGPHQNGDTSADPIQAVLPRVIDATQRVLISNGDFDYIVMTNATLLSIQNMTWGGQLGFQAPPAAPFNVEIVDEAWEDAYAASGLLGIAATPGQMGVQHYERGLMWVQVWGAGHMLPMYSPRAAYLHLQWVLGRIDKF